MKQLGVILVLAILSLLPVAGTAAQETPEMASLSIALWPEFDQPQMLVIYQGALAAETPLPVAVEFRIPARVGRPSAMAFLSPTGERLNQQYTTRVEGEYLVVSFELTSLGFQLEYYDALPTGAEGQREYTLDYTADYTIADLSVEFQLPRTGEGLVVEPQEGTAETGADGLLYHQIDVGAIQAGETVSWTFRYSKGDDTLTNPPTEASQPAAQPQVASGTTGDGDGNWVVTFLVAFLALVSVGGAAFWLGRSTRAPVREAPASSSRERRSRPGRRESAAAVFCYRCGSELRADSDFCHKCGAPVRE